MSINQGISNTFKSEILRGIHDFSTDVIKIALFYSTAELNETTVAYLTTGEVSGSGYSARGFTITATVSSSGSTAWVDFADLVVTASVTAVRGALIYNSSKSDRAIMVLDFGLDRIFPDTIVFPTPDSDNAFLRIR